MAPENIIEICVAIDIAILGIAYPIIVDKISNIGDKYASQYIPVIFNNEFPQRSVRFTIWKKGFEISLFKLLLGLTIFSFLFLIFPIPPPFGWNFWIINNSAKLIVLLLTSTLTILFFIWLDKVVLYNGNSKSLLKNLIIKYDDLKEDTEIKLYHLKAINELTYYAIDKQDEHLQETLLEFYYRVFSRIRKYHDKTKPLVYPIDLYFFVNKLINESSEINNKKLQAIEHRAVSGLWLLGEDYEAIQISEETYRWLWRNIYSISDKERLVRMYWANANQYFDYRLPNINTDFDYKTGTAINESDIKQRDEERRIFLEFHFALGGLLLYREQYKSLKYMLEYSQSEPPQYVLLPDSMTTIFIWFENFRNEFKNTGMPIDIKYSYPGLDNLGIRRQVNYWICCYLSILFIRQYLLNKYYIFQEYTAQPVLPDNVPELNNWLDSASYFEHCMRDIMKNQNLLNDIGFAEIVEAKRDDFETFITELKTSIINKIGEQKLKAPLSDEKIALFYDSTNRIISEAFNSYREIFNPLSYIDTNNEIKFSITGGKTILSKSAFTDKDIPTLYYESVFADQIANSNIKRIIPNSFSISRTKRYLLNRDNLLLGVEKAIGNNKDVAIVAINIGIDIKDILINSKFSKNTVMIPSTEYRTHDVLFILKKDDLPVIEHVDLRDEEKKELQFTNPINNEIKLYASVIDINLEKNKDIKDKWNWENKEGNLDLKVQLSIAFIGVIHWKKNRDIIQINIASQYKEQGIQNDINDIEPLTV